MAIWVLRELFEDKPRAVVFATKSECLDYAIMHNLKLNPTDRFGNELTENEYSIVKQSYFMENEC